MMPKDPEEQNQSEEETQAAPSEGASAGAEAELEKALAEQKAKADEYLATLQRTQADYANYRRRTDQEKADLGKYANATLFCDILPVLDDLELALNHIPEEYAKSEWVKGVRLVERKFRSILEKQGVKPVCALGMAFDPKLHEAIKQEKGPEGAVVAELQKGYTLGERLLRPARVIVGSGEPEEKAEEAPEKPPKGKN
jgi:molecular chaperone GrpE